MIKLCEPEIGMEELKAIEKVILSKQLVQGKEVQKLEQLVCDYLKVKHCIAVSSGTAALHLALLSLGIKEGDEVIVPNFTFPATANVVEIVGAETKLVDIKLDSYCIDESKIKNMITEKTKAIIPVHEFGQSADMDKIMEIAKIHGLRVVEDAACALGAEYKGNMVGTIGDLGCFSLHPRKAITTGEGGLIVTNNDELADKLKSLRNHGIRYKDGQIQFIEAGFNYRMTDIQGAIGIIQMKKLENIIERRKILMKEYRNLLKGEGGLTLPVEKKYGKHIYQTYHVLLDKKFNRELLIAYLKQHEIETNIGAYAVNMQWYYKEKYNYDDDAFKNSIIAYKQGIALPLYYKLEIEQVKNICQSIKEFVRGN